MPLFNMQAQTYCSPGYYDDCIYDDDINSFILTGHGTSVLSDLNTGCTSGGYLDRTTAITPVDLYPGQNYTLEINTSYPYQDEEYASIWIDFNNNGTFENTERIMTEVSVEPAPSYTTESITIPITASAGIRRMRVRLVYYGYNFTACSVEDYGETHDYHVNILSLPACTGTPLTGMASATVTNACAGTPFTLTLNGATIAGGITYQWQHSPAGANNFSDISGATSISHTVANQTTPTDYRCITTCSNGNTTSTSNTVAIGQNNLMRYG